MSKQNRRLREQFERRVSEILARPLADLQSRGWLPPALGGFSTMPITREAHAGRMREVLERDRAMVEALPPEPAPAPAQPPPFEVALTPIDSLSLPSNGEVTSATLAPQEEPEAELEEAEVTPVRVAPSRKKAACKEPIRTRTMAKLLLSQGHADRALSIYDALIADGASDPVLLAEADALRSLQT